MKKLITILFLLVQLGYGQLSGNYYIPQGANPQGYASLSAAISALNTNGCSGTVYFYIDDNLAETGANLVITRNDLSALNNLVVKPALTKTPNITITGCTNSAGASVFSGLTINGASFITIDGSNTVDGTSKDLTLTMNDATNGKMIIKLFGNADNINIKNLNLVYSSYLTTGADAAGIYALGSTSAATDNITIQNCTIGSSTPANAPYYGVHFYSENNYGATNILVENNTIYGRLRGVRLFKGVATGAIFTINKNSISVVEGNAAAYGIDLNNLVTATSNTAGTVNITNNNISSLKVNSANVLAGVFGSSISNATINVINNFIGGNITSIATSTGVYGLRWASTPPSVLIYHNTIVINSTNNASTNEAAAISVLGTVTIKNNILINERTNTNGYVIRNANTTIDYNNCVIGVGGNTSNFGTNSKSKAVTYTNTTDLHLSGQSVGDYELAGTPIESYTTDIDGQTRSTTFPYMGADENTNVVLAASYKRPVDGDAADWTGTASGTLHATAVSAEEAIYTGESGDSRTDQHGGGAGEDANNDITEFRFTRDQSYIYFTAKFRDITTLDRPYIAVGIDANQSDDTPSWIGDQSGVSLVPATNRAWERQLAVHATTSGNLNLEMFADDGSEWYAPLSNYQVSGSVDNNVIEFRVALHDLGITSSTTLNLAVATFNNNVGFNNVVDATTGSFIDVITAGYSGSNNAWFRAGSSNTDLNSNVSWNQSLSPLPVELTSFNASAFGKDVKISWATATEVNSYQFVVERSDNEVWNVVGTVNASGNSNSPKQYSFTDNNLQQGKYQYRLKMIDNDGSYEYSQTVEVDIDVPKEFALMQNYPNPFNPVTNINYTIPVDSKVMLVIYSISGEKVAELINETQSAGSYSIPFNASNLASGTYVYRLIANDFVQTKKMLLIK